MSMGAHVALLSLAFNEIYGALYGLQANYPAHRLCFW